MGAIERSGQVLAGLGIAKAGYNHIKEGITVPHDSFGNPPQEITYRAQHIVEGVSEVAMGAALIANGAGIIGKGKNKK